MKTRFRRIAILASLIATAIWWHSRPPEPTVLAFRLGQTFEQVANDSTYRSWSDQTTPPTIRAETSLVRPGSRSRP